MTKALAPNGVPALIWKHFASELTSVALHDVQKFWGHDHRMDAFAL